MTNQPPINPDALANLRLLADRATEEVRHAVIEPDILHKLLDIAVAQPVVNNVEVIRRLRRAMNGKYSSFDETYTIPRRDLEYLVLDLQGNNPFTEVKP